MTFGVDNGSRIGISHGALCVGELTCEEVYARGDRSELDLHLLGFESRSCGLHLCEVECLDVELTEGTLQFDVDGLRLSGCNLCCSEEGVACIVISDVVARERNVRKVGGVVVEVRVDVGARLVDPEDEVESLAGYQTRRERCREVLYGSYLTFAVEFAVEVDLHDASVDGRTVAGSTGFGHLSGKCGLDRDLRVARCRIGHFRLLACRHAEKKCGYCNKKSLHLYGFLCVPYPRAMQAGCGRLVIRFRDGAVPVGGPIHLVPTNITFFSLFVKNHLFCSGRPFFYGKNVKNAAAS